MAVLKVIADRHVRHSACTLTRDAIGDVSGTSRWTVERAVCTAAAKGLIRYGDAPRTDHAAGSSGTARRSKRALVSPPYRTSGRYLRKQESSLAIKEVGPGRRDYLKASWCRARCPLTRFS
jgi:hypothetical protein